MNLVSEKEFLDLPLVSVAEIVRCRGPKVSVFPFDGTRRWFHLECNPQYDDYQQAALRQSIRILKMLFEHGIETVISPIFSDDLLDRGDRYIVQALEGMALLANDEEILSFYKEHEVHISASMSPPHGLLASSIFVIARRLMVPTCAASRVLWQHPVSIKTCLSYQPGHRRGRA